MPYFEYYLARSFDDIMITRNLCDIEDKFDVKFESNYTMSIGAPDIAVNKYFDDVLIIKVSAGILFSSYSINGIDALKREVMLYLSAKRLIEDDYNDYRGYFIFLLCAKAARLPVAKDIKRLIFSKLFKIDL